MIESNVNEIVSSACKNKVCLEAYYSKASGERKRYEIVPVSIRRKGGSVMLYGYDLATSINKAFRMDRIISLNLMKSKPWPQNIKDKVGYRLELETSEEPVPPGAVKLKLSQ